MQSIYFCYQCVNREIIFIYSQIWEDWQRKSNAHRTAFFPTLNVNMPSTNLRPGAFIHNTALPGGVRAEYAPIANAQVRSVENILSSKFLFYLFLELSAARKL